MQTIYKKGRRKEYKLTEQLKREGWDIVQRTAGSHSPIDVFAINIKEKKILLIQCKRNLNEDINFIDKQLKEKIEKENKEFNNEFTVRFEAR